VCSQIRAAAANYFGAGSLCSLHFLSQIRFLFDLRCVCFGFVLIPEQQRAADEQKSAAAKKPSVKKS
jgi:hypothetical protein